MLYSIGIGMTIGTGIIVLTIPSPTETGLLSEVGDILHLTVQLLK